MRMHPPRAFARILLALLATASFACSRGATPPARAVSAERELVITDLAVVGDPPRARGPWSFGALMKSLAGDADPSAFTREWLRLFERDHVVEGARIEGRPLAARPAIQRWLDRSCPTCPLDFASAPFRLTAIVNRMDLRVIDRAGAIADAGEGRFIFALEVDGAHDGRSLAIIFEYALPAKSADDVKAWAARWHALGALEGEAYNAALEAITRDFALQNGAHNLHHVRTSEIGPHPWELREFHLEGGNLVLETGKHNKCAGCHLDRADFEHIHAESATREASLSRFLIDAEIPRRQRDLTAILGARDARGLRTTDHVD